MTSPDRSGLALYFTPGVTLHDWARSGFLGREVAYYMLLSACVGPVTFLTSGLDNRALARSLGSIRLLDNPKRLPQPLFDLTLPVRVARMRPRAAIVKTNQFAGTLGPALLRAVSGIRLVARGGYVPSEPWWHPYPLHPRRISATITEALLLHFSNLVFVTTPDAATYVARRYRVPPSKVHVVPNFVDVERFSADVPVIDGLVTMVGRLTRQKNVVAAIEAVAGLPGAHLRIIGDGPLRARCEVLARELGVAAEFMGTLDHGRLPQLIGESSVYLLASHYEGHPKSLIEAMAAAKACVVAPAPGVSSLIRDGETGLIAEDRSASALRGRLRTALADRDLAARIGAAARQEALAKYSLQRVLALECEIYRGAGWLGGG